MVCAKMSLFFSLFVNQVLRRGRSGLPTCPGRIRTASAAVLLVVGLLVAVLILILAVVLVLVIVLAVVLILVLILIVIHCQFLHILLCGLSAFVACPKIHDLSFGLKRMAARTPQTMAAVMPPAVAFRPPVKMPRNPSWVTASFTPFARL